MRQSCDVWVFTGPIKIMPKYVEYNVAADKINLCTCFMNHCMVMHSPVLLIKSNVSFVPSANCTCGFGHF